MENLQLSIYDLLEKPIHEWQEVTIEEVFDYIIPKVKAYEVKDYKIIIKCFIYYQDRNQKKNKGNILEECYKKAVRISKTKTYHNSSMEYHIYSYVVNKGYYVIVENESFIGVSLWDLKSPFEEFCYQATHLKIFDQKGNEKTEQNIDSIKEKFIRSIGILSSKPYVESTSIKKIIEHLGDV